MAYGGPDVLRERGRVGPALIMSPRDTSRWSARRRLTDWGAYAASASVPSTEMPVISEVSPEG